MRLFGRLRRASANNRSTSSVVAPASAKIGPAASAPSLGLAPDFSSWPIIFAIWAMAVAASFSASPVSAAQITVRRNKAQLLAEGQLGCGRPQASTIGIEVGRLEFGKLAGTVLLEPREESDTR